MNYTQQEKICIYLAHREVSAAHFYAALEQTDVLHIADVADNLFGKEGKSIAQGLAAGEADRVCDELDKLGVVAVTCFPTPFRRRSGTYPIRPTRCSAKGTYLCLTLGVWRWWAHARCPLTAGVSRRTS